MRWIVGSNAVEREAVSTSQMGRFETERLVSDENLTALTGLFGQWIDSVNARRAPRAVVLDMDSSVSPTYGDQEGAAYDSLFAYTCYGPRFVFVQIGDMEPCVLRPGNVHSADGWMGALEPVVARYRATDLFAYFHADVPFAKPEVYAFYEAKGYQCAIRLPTKHPPRQYRLFANSALSAARYSRFDTTTPVSTFRRKAGRCHAES